MNAGIQFTFSFSASLGPQPMDGAAQMMVCPRQLTQSKAPLQACPEFCHLGDLGCHQSEH